MAILCKPQPSSARQTASSPARAGAADKYLKLKGQEEGWGAVRGLGAPRRRRREIRQRSSANPKSTKSKWGWGAGVPRPPGPISYREHSRRGKGHLARKGAPSGRTGPGHCGPDGWVRGVT